MKKKLQKIFRNLGKKTNTKRDFCLGKNRVGFTLMELLIAISIFSIIATVGSSLYIRSFRETRQSNLQNQVFEDARFIMSRLMQEVRQNAIDYDEYYNQNVVIPSVIANIPVPGHGLNNYGQNFGRYYSSFFNPGTDFVPGIFTGRLGFECNDGTRNQPSCMPLRKTIDRNTGSNPFEGKYNGPTEENAFCGAISYAVLRAPPNNKQGKCGGAPNRLQKVEDKLYLISADAKTKTIFAREAISFWKVVPAAYALSMLKLSGEDKSGDGLVDSFVCADGFQCRGSGNVITVEPDKNPDDFAACGNAGNGPAELPRADNVELSSIDQSGTCDPKSGGFSKDFVPVSPLRLNIKTLNFYITPTDDPYYAFAESSIKQPKVTIVLTVELNPSEASPTDKLEPITLVETVSAGVTTPIPAPVLVQN